MENGPHPVQTVKGNMQKNVSRNTAATKQTRKNNLNQKPNLKNNKKRRLRTKTSHHNNQKKTKRERQCY